MIDAACGRWKLLKKIALLFCGLMVSTVMSACPSHDNTALPSVIGMYFYDAGMQKVDLRGNQNVPVRTQFEVVFSTDMNTDTQHSLFKMTFVDSYGNSSAITVSWVDAKTLSVIPDADLVFNTEYTLTINDAEDTRSNPLNPYANASATFRTSGS